MPPSAVAAPEHPLHGGGGAESLSQAALARERSSAAAAAREERLHVAATSAALWRRPAEDCGTGLFGEAKDRYASASEYVATLEPLLFEEAREEVRQEWAAACEVPGGKGLHAVRVASVRPDGTAGWHVASLAPLNDAVLSHTRLLPDRAVAVMSSSNPSGKDPWRDFSRAAEADAKHAGACAAAHAAAAPAAGGAGGGDNGGGGSGGGGSGVQPAAPPPPPPARSGAAAALHVAGFIVKTASAGSGAVSLCLRFFVSPLDGASRPPEERHLFFPPSAALAALKDTKAVWHVAACGHLASSAVEFRALHGVRHLSPPLLRALLDPPPPPPLLPAHPLLPGGAVEDGELGDERQPPPPPLAPELSLPKFLEHLHGAFNAPQRAAICFAADAVAASERAGGSPFTLVQGPPGTGKTHAVWGMLNVIHLAAYQRYYKLLLATLTPRSAAAAAAAEEAQRREAEAVRRRALYGDEADDMDEDGLEEGDGPNGWGALNSISSASGHAVSAAAAVPKPRILVCAPSNAAVDTLLLRVMEAGFVQGDGGTYRPSLARVASDDAAMPPRAKEVCVGAKADALLRMSAGERAAWKARHEDAARRMHARIGSVAKAAEAAAAPRRAQDVGAPDSLQGLLRELAHVAEQYDRTLVELGRLAVIDGVAHSEKPGRGAARGEGGGPGGGRAARASAGARFALEASLVAEAEIVFTTLSSASKGVFAKLAAKEGVRFDLVLIDEAAQASEVASLVPLCHGAKAVVLVGDPRQLPATVLSSAARRGLYSRSLFQRLEACGARSLLLTVQFRMHPAIRSWPSSFFYEGRLVDAPSVTSSPDEPFYAAFPLRPYAFFDVAAGREARGTAAAGATGGNGGGGGAGEAAAAAPPRAGGGAAAGGGSLRNDAEAALAVSLFAALRAALPAGAAANRVGFVTPYRQQKAAIIAALAARFGPAVLAETTVDTVDGFQGQVRSTSQTSLHNPLISRVHNPLSPGAGRDHPLPRPRLRQAPVRVRHRPGGAGLRDGRAAHERRAHPRTTSALGARQRRLPPRLAAVGVAFR